MGEGMQTQSLLGLDERPTCLGCGRPEAAESGDRTSVQTACPSCGLSRQSFGGEDTRARAGPDPGEANLAKALEHPELTRRFEVVKKLGQGGMGAVFVARDRELDRTVALKLVLGGDREQIKRFHREGQVLARLSHSNILRLFSVEEIGETPVLVMELLEGRTLKADLARKGRYGLAAAREGCRKILDGLAAAHRQGVVHRDLKPENVLLVATGETLKILDFGLARHGCGPAEPGRSTLTAAGTVMGTPVYMSPEQCRGERADARSDLYAVGVTLFELVTGRVPFMGSYPMETLLKHIQEPPPRLADLVPGVPESLEEIVRTALSKRPEDRFGDARTFERALARVRVLPEGAQDPGAAGADEWEGASATTQLALAAPRLPAGGRKSDRVRTVLAPPPPAQTPARARWTWRATAGLAVAGVLLVGLAGLVVMRRSPGPRVDPVTVSGTDPPSPVRMGPKAAPGASRADERAPTGRDEPPTSIRPEPDGEEMVLIPAGEFRMGSDDGVPDEKPVHSVHVDAFYMDRHEVTNRRYRRFVEATGHRRPPYWVDARFNAAEQPVVGVSWEDAVAFARWAGKELPTEAQWEKAARGGLEGKRYPWGNEDPSSRRASYNQLWKTGRPEVVGRFAPNRYRLFDMAGNVWEWCADWYGDGYYATTPDRNPRGPSSGTSRVVRGGSWNDGYAELRSASRFEVDPARGSLKGGFRCARSR